MHYIVHDDNNIFQNTVKYFSKMLRHNYCVPILQSATVRLQK